MDGFFFGLLCGAGGMLLFVVMLWASIFCRCPRCTSMYTSAFSDRRGWYCCRSCGHLWDAESVERARLAVLEQDWYRKQHERDTKE